MKLKAIFLLSDKCYDWIYGEKERKALENMLEFVHPQLNSENVWNAPREILEQVEVIVSGWGMAKLDAKLLERFPRLKLVLYGAGTIRDFATPEMWERGIRVVSAWAMNAIPVSEFTLAEILFSLKQGWKAAYEFKAGRGKRPLLESPGCYGSTVGLISLGMIGRLVLKRLKTFDLKLVAYDPFVSAQEAKQLDIEILPLLEVFKISDVVSCHTPWLKETEKMIGEKHFEVMKKNATFINTARGAVVDEEGMINVLKARPDITAVLDVTYPEPPIETSPLYDMPNVVLTPHIAGSSGDECKRMGACMVQELERYLRGEDFLYELTKEKVAKMA